MTLVLLYCVSVIVVTQRYVSVIVVTQDGVHPSTSSHDTHRRYVFLAIDEIKVEHLVELGDGANVRKEGDDVLLLQDAIVLRTGRQEMHAVYGDTCDKLGDKVMLCRFYVENHT